MDTRQIFEEWYAGNLPKALERNADGGYKYMPANTAWYVWQAAVEAEREACARKTLNGLPNTTVFI